MSSSRSIHSIAVVIPVYLGESTLESVVKEVLQFVTTSESPSGNYFKVSEVILVNDCGPDGSAAVIRKLALDFEIVRPVWLSRNFGQHAATIAGIAASSADWVVTLDEDGQHDPCDISRMLDSGILSRSSVVYAQPSNGAKHSILRNLGSSIAKRLAAALSGARGPLLFTSFRLVSGEIARSVAAYAGPSVYLDVALSWIAQDVSSVSVEYRDERRRYSGYSTRKLIGHFWKLALTTGTRPLRLVSLAGALTGILGFVLASKIVFDRLAYGVIAQGWASVFVGILILGGAVLFSVGVIAEYLGLVVRSSLGQPTYLTVRDPHASPRFGQGTGTEKQ
jgi:glycosyltransferase involved in cell wall biosynthesis